MDTQSTSAAFGRRDFLLGGLAAAGLSVAGETGGPLICCCGGTPPESSVWTTTGKEH